MFLCQRNLGVKIIFLFRQFIFDKTNPAWTAMIDVLTKNVYLQRMIHKKWK